MVVRSITSFMCDTALSQEGRVSQFRNDGDNVCYTLTVCYTLATVCDCGDKRSFQSSSGTGRGVMVGGGQVVLTELVNIKRDVSVPRRYRGKRDLCCTGTEGSSGSRVLKVDYTVNF